MDAIGSTTIRVAWWTGDKSQVSRYSVSCCESLANKQNDTVVTDVGHIQNVTVLDFMDRSINSIRVGQLLPFTRYRCCLVEHYVNSTITAEVCQHTIMLLPITRIAPPVSNSESVECPNNSHVGSTVSLFVMMLLGLFCTLLLTLLVIKQGKDGQKITHW